MSARAEVISLVNDIRLDFDRGRGTLGEVADRFFEIATRLPEYEDMERLAEARLVRIVELKKRIASLREQLDKAEA